MQNVRVEVKVEGIQEVVSWLTGPFAKAAQAASDDALDETLTLAKERAQKNAPVGTPQSTGIPGYIGGSHRKSIRKERLAKPAGFFTYQGIRAGGYVINPNTGRIVHYSHWLEYGNSKMRPRPHIRPAVRWAVKGLPTRFYHQLGRRIRLE